MYLQTFYIKSVHVLVSCFTSLITTYSVYIIIQSNACFTNTRVTVAHIRYLKFCHSVFHLKAMSAIDVGLN
jgi:hypothetical protein